MTILRPSPVPATLHGLPAGILLLAGRRADGTVIGEHQGLHVGHLAAPDPCRTGLSLLSEPGLAAATAFTPGNERQAWLALEFAIHLAGYRREHAIRPVPCLTSPARPDPVPDGAVRIPHLAEVADPHGQVADLVIWELMTGRDATAWLGQPPLPCQAWFEDHLPALLSLRRQIRDGTLPDDPRSSRLTAALAGRYLSIRFAYQHPALIADATATARNS
jgi:hypothetical protein